MVGSFAVRLIIEVPGLHGFRDTGAKVAVLPLILMSVLAFLPSFNSAQADITVINALSYPWLSKGAYADYTSTYGSAPAFILQNGTVLLGGNPAGPPTLPQGWANVTLDWTVLNRTNDMVWVSIAFHMTGCEYSQAEYRNHQRCTNFNFSDAKTLEVNVTDDETYLNGESVGKLNFWGPPLLIGGAIYSGTAFIDGTASDSLANVTWNPKMNLGISIKTSSGIDTGPYNAYQLTPASYGYGSNSVYAWENVSGSFYYNGKLLTTFPMFAPSGTYDSYNGLGIQVSSPAYPIDQTVCGIQDGQLEDCRVALYATTLGNLFRSGAASLDLTSTNIPLGPTQPVTSSSPGVQSFPLSVNALTAFAVGLSIVAISISYVLLHRKLRMSPAKNKRS